MCGCVCILGHDYACNKRGYVIYYIVTYNTVVATNKSHNAEPIDEQGIPI